MDLYTEAVEVCLEAKKNTQNSSLQEKLGRLAMDALDRAETIKTRSATTAQPRSVTRPLGNLLLSGKGKKFFGTTIDKPNNFRNYR